MFVEPEVTNSKATAKADPSAPARSTIRRQRTVRYSPHLHNRPVPPRTQFISNARDASRRSLLEAIRRGDSAVASARADEEELVDIEVEANLAHTEAAQRRRLESGRALLRDALSYERQGGRIRPRHHHHHHHHPHHHHRLATQASANPRHHGFTAQGLPYYSDPRSASTIANIDGSSPQPAATEIRSPPPEYMPTPPYTSGDASNRSTPSNTTPPLGTASFTPRFAPAHRYTETAETAFREYAARHNLDGPTDQDLDSLPPLRRMTNWDRPYYSSQRTSPHPNTVDGLGDRRRSFSPENDSWETLLTTIAPDERLPSIHSSFTSATASASSLSSNSATSYGARVTDPSSSAEILDTYPTICDNTDSEDSDSDNGDYAAMERQILDPSGDNSSAEARLRRRVRMRALESDRADQLARQRRILEREEGLHQTQANRDRLHRHVPEEWAAAEQDRATGARMGRERL